MPRAKHPKHLPKIKHMEEQASAGGYDPSQLAMRVMGYNQKRLNEWMDYLTIDKVPPDMDMKLGGHRENMANAWKTFFLEAVAFQEWDSRYLEYFFGKRQRIDQNIDAKVESKDVTEDPPLTDEEWEETDWNG